MLKECFIFKLNLYLKTVQSLDVKVFIYFLSETSIIRLKDLFLIMFIGRNFITLNSVITKIQPHTTKV